MRMTSLAITLAFLLFQISDGRADTLCPKGSLSDLLPGSVWNTYVNRNREHVNGWLRRLANNLAVTVHAQTTSAQVRAAMIAGDDNGRVMRRMFEEGFIAATDIMNAHCSTIPSQEPWSENIKKTRQRHWCKEWPDAHFCPKQ